MTYEITKPYESTKKVGLYSIKRSDLVHPELYFTIAGILGDYFSRQTIDQVNQYLKATGLKLGVIAAFTSRGVKTKRIVNLSGIRS